MERYITKLNIERFRQLIATETYPKKLETLHDLLRKEEATLAAFPSDECAGQMALRRSSVPTLSHEVFQGGARSKPKPDDLP